MLGDALGALRLHLSGHPFLAMIATVALLRLAARVRGRALEDGWLMSVACASIAVASLVGLAAYVGVVVFYAGVPHYFDAAEPTMTALGWLFNTGHPVYHAVDSAERYAHIYGPMAFIVQGVALDLFGPSIQTSKWVGGSLALAGLALTFCALRSKTTTWRAVILVGTCALLLLGFRNYSFWTRAEPLQVFCVSAALVAAACGRGYIAATTMGICAGVLWNVKITGPLYSLPLFALLVHRLGWRPSIVSAFVALTTAILPFVVFPNVSFDSYLTWVRLSAQTGLLLSTLRQNIEWVTYFAVPIVLSYYVAPPESWHRGAERSWVALALGAAACGIVIAASKPGAGPYHLLPLLPIVCYLVASQLAHAATVSAAPVHLPLAATAFIVVAVLIALAQQVQFLTTMAGRRARDEIGDIQRFVEGHPGVVEMGYGSNDPFTFQRPVLVFRNNSYFLDQPAIGEHQLAGLPIPPATIEALRLCRVDYWLIPKAETPFSAVNMYAAVYRRPLYSEEFRRAFFETHTLVDSTAYFDAWRCHATAPATFGALRRRT